MNLIKQIGQKILEVFFFFAALFVASGIMFSSFISKRINGQKDNSNV